MLTEFTFFFLIFYSQCCIRKKGIYGSMEKKEKIKTAPESTNLKAFILDLAVTVHKKAQCL